MENEMKNGQLTYPDGRVFEGTQKDQRPHGRGKMIFPGGEVYEGDFVEGKAEGQGVMTWPNGNRYSGSWKGNLRHGLGRYEWNSDDSLKDTITHIQGEKARRPQKGNWYWGDWRDDKPAGRGEFFFAHLGGATYKGEVSDWAPNGIGKMHWPTGSEYIGSVTGGVMNGEGLYISGKTGIAYDGSWLNDARHGRLVMKDCTMKTVYAGNWEHNRMLDADKVEDVVFADGSRYSGGWHGNGPHGHGVMIYPNGIIVESEWEKGLPREIDSINSAQKAIPERNGCIMNTERFNRHFTVTPHVWGEAKTKDVSAVLASVAGVFEAAFGSDYVYASPTQATVVSYFYDSEPYNPQAAKKWPASPGCKDDNTEILLKVQDRKWNIYIYQFGQMLYWYMHNHRCNRSFTEDETIFVRALPLALGAVAVAECAKAWEKTPPYPNWLDYAAVLHRYFLSTLKAFAAESHVCYEIALKVVDYYQQAGLSALADEIKGVMDSNYSTDQVGAFMKRIAARPRE